MGAQAAAWRPDMSDQKDPIGSFITKAQENLEQALAELEKLPATDLSSVAFATHALNNYLMVADATLLVLRRDLGNDQGSAVNTLLSNLDHLTQLMTFTVARLMNAAAKTIMPIQITEVDLATVARRISDYHQRSARYKDIQILYAQTGAIAPIWTDRVSVAAVLESLLSNAVKYSPRGRLIHVELHSDNSGVVCTVEDEGPGLSSEEQRDLFKPGVRLSAVPTGGESSSGYGLSVAKALVDRLDGSIWCKSSRGNGASFGIRLPDLRLRKNST
jgi:signal transduction histidine kinase